MKMLYHILIFILCVGFLEKKDKLKYFHKTQIQIFNTLICLEFNADQIQIITAEMFPTGLLSYVKKVRTKFL